MKRRTQRLTRGAVATSAALLAGLFVTVLVQLAARLVMQTPFGWTQEPCLIPWVWLVFSTAAFTLREHDRFRFDIITRAASRGLQRRLALVPPAAIARAMAWSVLPSWAYIDFLAIRRTAAPRDPFTGDGIPMRTVFSIYAVSLLALAGRYGWRALRLLRGPLDDGPYDPIYAEPGDGPA